MSNELDIIEGVATALINLQNILLLEFLKQNYIYIILGLIVLFLLWFIGLLIKNWVWKIDKISNSLESIANNIDFLTNKFDKNFEQEGYIKKDKNSIYKNKSKRFL